MFRIILLTAMLSTGAITLPNTALADTETGPYVGGGLGLGHLDFSSIGLTKKHTDDWQLAGRFSAGYRLTKHWGVAVGYSRIGRFKNRYQSGDSTVFYSGTAHAAWLALTARVPVSERFALLSDIKLGRNWIHTEKQTANITQFRRLDGAQTVLLLGAVGVEFSLDKKSSFNVQLEGFGEAADSVEPGILTFNYQHHF